MKSKLVLKWATAWGIALLAGALFLPANADTVTRSVDQSGTPVITIKGAKPPTPPSSEAKKEQPKQDTRKEYRVYELKPLPAENQTIEEVTASSSRPLPIPAPPAIAPSQAPYSSWYGYPYEGYANYYGYSYWGYGYPSPARYPYWSCRRQNFNHRNHAHSQPRPPINRYQNPPVNYQNPPINYQNPPINYQNPPLRY